MRSRPRAPSSDAGTTAASGRARCEQRLGATPRRPRTSGTSGTSQITNCGEKTLPKASIAATAAAAYATSRSPSRAARVAAPRPRRARATPAIVVTIAAACAPGPVRFCEPKRRDDVQRRADDVVQRDEQRAAEALELQRPRDLRVEAVPAGRRARARRTAGRSRRPRRTSAGSHAPPRAGRASARRATTTSGASTAGQSFAAIAAPSTSAASVEPLVQQRREREHRERGRPEVEARQDDGPDQQRRDRDEPERGRRARGPGAERAQRERRRRRSPGSRTAPSARSNQRSYAARSPSWPSDGSTKTGSAPGGYSSRKSRYGTCAVRHRVAVRLVDAGVDDLPARERAVVEQRPGARETQAERGRRRSAAAAARLIRRRTPRRRRARLPIEPLELGRARAARRRTRSGRAAPAPSFEIQRPSPSGSSGRCSRTSSSVRHRVVQAPDQDARDHIRKTPNVVSGIGALSAAARPSASTRRVSSGSMMPSSHSRAVE